MRALMDTLDDSEQRRAALPCNAHPEQKED